MDRIRIGIIGCGNISGAYFNHAKLYDSIEIAAVADLNRAVAEAKAAEHNIPKVMEVADLLKDKSIELVLNLTIPAAHVPVGLQAIKAGKHIYSEKPLGISVAEGKKLIAAAQRKGVRIGCAPDTFFGAGQQTARKLLDDGAIGKPLAATAFMLCRGHESWHPSPVFYYKPGGGPMFDMGPYYLTALINMLGPVKRVCGFATICIPQRTITHNDKSGAPGPLFGQKIDVETPDHVAGTIEFASGAVASIVTSFATAFGTYDGNCPITIYGSQGTMKVPDPNGFDGPVYTRRLDEADFAAAPFTHAKGFSRMAGVVDMAQAIRDRRPHRASGALSFAVLQCMGGFLKSSQTGKAVTIDVPDQRPAPLATTSAPGRIDG